MIYKYIHHSDAYGHLNIHPSEIYNSDLLRALWDIEPDKLELLGIFICTACVFELKMRDEKGE